MRLRALPASTRCERYLHQSSGARGTSTSSARHAAQVRPPRCRRLKLRSGYRGESLLASTRRLARIAILRQGAVASIVFSFTRRTHGVPIHVTRDRLADRIAYSDRARIVHAAPHPGVVPVRPCLRNARIRAVRLSCRRECERLSVAKVDEKDGCRRPVLAGCPAGYSGCDGVLTRGSQSPSGAVSGLPSVSASGIAVTGRHVTSVGSEP